MTVGGNGHDPRPVLVTGGEFRIALSATRALGRRGIPAAVMASRPYAITFHSRYCTRRVLTPPDYHKSEYQDFVRSLVRREEFSGILFCDDLSAYHIGEIRDDLSPHVPVLLPGHEWIELSMNKRRMLQFSAEHGIDIPSTGFPLSVDGLAAASRGLRAPLMIKGVRGDSSRHLRVLTTGSDDEMKKAFLEIERIERDQGIEEMPVVQEYVTGDVFSAIVLCDNGAVVASFIMKKVRTFPDWGGICVEGESVADEAARAAVTAFFAKVPWHGIAEVEFILDPRDGGYKFVELNPDFNWGLDFAVHAGVDFPYLAYRMMRGDPAPPAELPRYEAGRRFLWFLPEGVKYIRRHPASIPGFLIKALHPRIGSDLRVNDAGALVRQVKRSLRSLLAP